MAQRIVLAVCVVLALAAGPAGAATQAPYERDLVRLAEILGALHHLRAICGSNEGQAWRDEMVALLEGEAGNPARHDRLIESFNRGYRGFRQSHRTCTPAAQVAIQRYLEEGARLARDVSSRYGN